MSESVRRLAELELQRKFRSGESDLFNDFYEPCIAAASSYRRAAGFLSASSLFALSEGLEVFSANGGVIQLVVSPILSEPDYAQLAAGHASRKAIADRSATIAVREATATKAGERRLAVLGRLIADRQLEIKLAVPIGNGGIYHEKFGVFEDQFGDRVAFHGSANESRAALVANFESILIFRSWFDEEMADVQSFVDDFDQLWSNETPALDVIGFPDAVKRDLVSIAEFGAGRAGGEVGGADFPGAGFPATPRVLPARSTPPRLSAPEGLTLRDYQRAALAAWFRADAIGLLEMATGAGKTLTALSGFEKLANQQIARGNGAFAVIVCPYQHLVDQWAAEARRFGADPILCYRSQNLWRESFVDKTRLVREGIDPFGVVVVTNATFQSQAFQSLLDLLPETTMLIADEVHNFGSEAMLEMLPTRFKYRLGLSATPERAHDLDGTRGILDYFGDVVFSFDLKDAIESGALTPYEYRVTLVDLEDDELERYVELTVRLARSISEEGIEGDRTQLLLIARARLLANARGKVPALMAAVAPYANSPHTLVYCGDGSADGDTGEAGERQIEAAVRALGKGLAMRVASYTSETSVSERVVLRERFAEGDLQALVAIRCLDEGVDIPETERAFILASSTNPRQFVQRRGRVLRKSPGTGKTKALVHDFLVMPPRDSSGLRQYWETERRLVTRELERVVSFAELAINRAQILEELRDIRIYYRLMHV